MMYNVSSHADLSNGAHVLVKGTGPFRGHYGVVREIRRSGKTVFVRVEMVCNKAEVMFPFLALAVMVKRCKTFRGKDKNHLCIRADQTSYAVPSYFATRGTPLEDAARGLGLTLCFPRRKAQEAERSGQVVAEIHEAGGTGHFFCVV